MKKYNPFPPVDFYVWDTDITPEDYYSILNEARQAGHNLKENPKGILTEYDQPNSSLFFDGWLKLLHKFMNHQFKEFINDSGAVDINILGLWTQITKDHVWHGPHNHGAWGNASNWSFAWYVDVDEKVHQGTRYYSTPMCVHEWVVDAKQGKFIMWPSNVIHCQLPSNSGIDRAIISGNIVLVK
jgi:hypothetical protein